MDYKPLSVEVIAAILEAVRRFDKSGKIPYGNIIYEIVSEEKKNVTKEEFCESTHFLFDICVLEHKNPHSEKHELAEVYYPGKISVKPVKKCLVIRHP